MARFDTSGIDDIIHAMDRMRMSSGPLAAEMVNAAVEEIKLQWRLSAGMHGHVDTGQMLDSIDFGPGPLRAADIIFRDVYPQGTDNKGVRNATKAFVLNYGRSYGRTIKPGTQWVEEADDNSADPVRERLQAIWDRFLETGG